MDNLIVDVKLRGQMVGSLIWDTSSKMAVFEYDSRFRHNGFSSFATTFG